MLAILTKANVIKKNGGEFRSRSFTSFLSNTFSRFLLQIPPVLLHITFQNREAILATFQSIIDCRNDKRKVDE